MMKRFGLGLLCAVGAYAITALVDYFLIEAVSSNAHDRTVEAAMTSVFFLGPVGAIVGFVVGLVVGGRIGRGGGSRNETVG